MRKKSSFFIYAMQWSILIIFIITGPFAKYVVAEYRDRYSFFFCPKKVEEGRETFSNLLFLTNRINKPIYYTILLYTFFLDLFFYLFYLFYLCNCFHFETSLASFFSPEEITDTSNFLRSIADVETYSLHIIHWSKVLWGCFILKNQ